MPINFNLESVDDQVQADTSPNFVGGQVSNERANLIQPNQCAQLTNCDINKFGKITTRRGTARIGSGVVGGVGTCIQGMANFQTATYNYPVAANDGKLWKWDGVNWVRIALGGIADNTKIKIIKFGRINNPGGYPVGTTTMTINNFTSIVQKGDLLIVKNESAGTLLDFVDWDTYNIIDHAETGPDTTSITIDNPGLFRPAIDVNTIMVIRFGAMVNHPGGYPGGINNVDIDGYIGALSTFAGDFVTLAGIVFEGENQMHYVTGHSEFAGNTTNVTFSPALQGAYDGDPTAQISFAQGIDKLFWCDGVDLWGWDGINTANMSHNSVGAGWDVDVSGDYWTHPELWPLSNGINQSPPRGARFIVWFQNRLIVSSIVAEPDAVYFSDFLDSGHFDRTFQQVRIGGGENDPITGMIAWTDLNLIILKQHSIYVVNCDPSQNLTPEDPTALVGSFAIKLVNKHIGCMAPFTAVQVGGESAVATGDIFFLSDSGVRSMKRVIATETQQEIGEALSFPVADVIERLNDARIGFCAAAYHDNHYILGLCLDGSSFPNHALVFSTLNQSWLGTWEGWNPTSFALSTPAGSTHIFMFGRSNGEVFKWLDEDTVATETDATFQDNGVDIATSILTRAYSFGDLFCPKTGFNCEFEFYGSLADVNIQAILDFVTSSDPVGAFSTNSADPLRKALDLQRYGQFRELQFLITSTAKKLSMRSVRLTGFFDSMILQN